MNERTVYGVIAVVILTGCATPNTPPPPIVGHATALPPQQIPVLVPCLTRDKIPSPPATWMRPNRSGDYNEAAANVDLLVLDQYVVESQSRLWACIETLEQMKKEGVFK